MDYSFSLKNATGKFPDKLPDELKLNLGCGSDIRKEYLNLDLYSDNPEVIYCDVRKIPLPDNSVCNIIANDILDLFSHRETDLVLKEWHRILMPNADITIRIPNLKAQIDTYNLGEWDADVFAYMLFGSQTNPYNFRAMAFDTKSISSRLLRTGFKISDIQELNYSQDKGFINHKILLKATKIANTLIVEQHTNDSYQHNLFEQLDYSNNIQDDSNDYTFLLNDNTANSKINSDKFIVNTDDNLPNTKINDNNYNDFDDYDLDLLAEIVSGDYTDTIQNNTIKNTPFINIVWEGSQFVYHSLALINREHCYNIIKSDIANLTIIPYEPDTFDFNTSEKYKLLAANDIRYKDEVTPNIANLPYCWIRHQWPPKAEPPKGSKWIIMQPWEFTSLRKDFLSIFNQADEIWTPSNYSRKSFVDSGVDFNKVQIIPNGINPELFTPLGNKYPLATNKKLKLLFVGGTIYRKGIDILLQAYIKLFKSSDDITLIIKDIGTNSFYKGQTNQQIINEINNTPDAPEIIYLDKELTEIEITSLYRACDILIYPYRGEGFALPVLEAMACGLPVVVTDGGSTDDFVDDIFSWKIPAIKKSIGYEMNGIPFVNEAFLLEPNLEDLINILRTVATNPYSLKSMGMIAQYYARTNWNWHKSTLKLLNRLDYLYGTNMSMKAQNKLNTISDGSTIVGEAEANYITGDYSAAEVLFRKAIDSQDISDEYKLHSLHRLAIIYINNNNDDDYNKVVKLAENISSDHQDTNYVKAIKFAALNNPDEALMLTSKIIEEWDAKAHNSSLGYTIDDMLVLSGDLIFAKGELESALQLYTSALKINSQNEYACYGAGRCFKEGGLIPEAKDMFQWAIKINPEFTDAIKEIDTL